MSLIDDAAFLLMLIFIILLLLFISKNIAIVKQDEVMIIFKRLKFYKILRKGIHFLIPFIDFPITVYEKNRSGEIEQKRKMTLKEQLYEYKDEYFTTKDNVIVKADISLRIAVHDPLKAVGMTQNYPRAVDKILISVLHNIIGGIEFKNMESQITYVNENLEEIMSEAMDQWGLKIISVKIHDFINA